MHCIVQLHNKPGRTEQNDGTEQDRPVILSIPIQYTTHKYAAGVASECSPFCFPFPVLAPPPFFFSPLGNSNTENGCYSLEIAKRSKACGERPSAVLPCVTMEQLGIQRRLTRDPPRSCHKSSSLANQEASLHGRWSPPETSRDSRLLATIMNASGLVGVHLPSSWHTYDAHLNPPP